MPSIRRELERTRTARWYEEARASRRSGAWTERVRDYAALCGLLAEHAAAHPSGPSARRRSQSPIELSGLVLLVAERQHFAGAEPVYRRYRYKQDSKAIPRWADHDSSVKPAAALVAEAKIASFWPYREGVIMVADAFDMTPFEWAAAYLRALGAWAADDRPLAACAPAGPPECVLEDLTVLAAAATPHGPVPETLSGVPRQHQVRRGCAEPAGMRAARLGELAADVVQAMLDDVSMPPLGAFNTVRDEVGHLLTVPSAPLADRLARTIAELADQILHAGATDRRPADAIVGPDQASQLRALLDGLGSLLDEVGGRQPAFALGTAEGLR